MTRFWKLGVMVESIRLISYPARRSGVDMARIPSGAVASWLEKAGKKKTTFLDPMALPLNDTVGRRGLDPPY